MHLEDPRGMHSRVDHHGVRWVGPLGLMWCS
jgi:hypothetical protein